MHLLKNKPNSSITWLSFALTIVTGIIAGFAIVSWGTNALHLITVNGDTTIIKLNTAICFLFAVIAYGLTTVEKYKTPGIVLAIVLIGLNLLNLSQYIFGYNLGIDEFFLKDSYTQPQGYPGRMTINTSLFFLFTSFFTICLSVRLKPKITELLIPPFWAATVLALVAYGYSFANSERIPNHHKLSPVTVIECFLLATAILVSRSDEGFLAPFTKKTETAKHNSRMLVYGILLTLFFGWLRLRGELSGLLQHDIGIALMAAAYILIIMYFTKITTVKLNYLEQSLKKEQALSEQIINSLPAIFFVTDKDNRFIRYNDNLLKATCCSKEEIEQLTPHHFFPESERYKVDNYLQQAKEKGLVVIESDLIDNEGNVEPFFFRTMAIDYNGEPCLIGTGVNISERKNAEEEIKLLNRQLRSLNNRLDNIREEERTTIAREIHDELGQQLTVFKINLAWLKSLPKDADAEFENLTTEMLALSDSMIHSVRRIAHDLRPPALEDLGLAEALRIYSEEFEMRSGVSIHFYSELDQLELPEDTGKAFYRIFQESLTNVARYANATHVEALLDLEDDEIILSVSDNGIGFDIDSVTRKKTLGIIGMRERALITGGKFEINSKPNCGTTVLVRAPLYQEADSGNY
ncbi:PAS domain-containing sensor histidine kinase [Lacibacter cauensis]|nr:histidine kinase [Lacibacter cauensis]